MQLELAVICFGISSFLRRGTIGIGLGIACMMYFLNIIANVTETVDFLKYITPFGYCEGADILTNNRLDTGMIMIGMLLGIIGIIAAYLIYSKKDIH